MDLFVASIAERPDLTPLLDDFLDAFPALLYHDPVAAFYYDIALSQYPEFCLVAADRDKPDRGLATVRSIPFFWPEDPSVRLPPGGHDEVILRAAADRLTGRQPNLVAVIEAVVQPELRGTRAAELMLVELTRRTRELGFSSLVSPVRPTNKHRYPDMSIADYAAWTRRDGLPMDPWLRILVRAGCRIVGVTQRSMTVAAGLDRWREWTGLPFDTSGPVRAPDTLAPVHCDVTGDVAVYAEPNVWVHYKLD